MRRGRGDLEQIQDLFAGEDQAFAFQDMQLGMTPDDEDMFWPETIRRNPPVPHSTETPR